MLGLLGWSSLPAGLLPKWLWIVGVTSVLNTIQAFVTLSATRRIYANKPQEGKDFFANCTFRSMTPFTSLHTWSCSSQYVYR